MKVMYKTPPNTTVRTSLNQSSPSPSRLAVQMSYMERRYDEILGKVLDQNALILNSVSRMQEDIKNLRVKLESLEVAAQEEPITKPSSSSQVNGVDSLRNNHTTTSSNGGGINGNTLPASSQGTPSLGTRGVGGYNGQPQLPSPYQQQSPYFYNPYAHPMYANPYMMMPPMAHDPMSHLNPAASLYGPAAAMFSGWNPNAFIQEDNKSQEHFKTSVPIVKPTTTIPEVVADRKDQVTTPSPVTTTTTTTPKINNTPSAGPSTQSQTQITAAPKKDFSELFKKPEGEWNCNTCYSPNRKEVFTCMACQTPKPGAIPPPTVPKQKETVPSAPKFTFGFSPSSSTLTSSTTTTTISTPTSVTVPIKNIPVSTTTTAPASKPPPVVNLFSSPSFVTPQSTITSKSIPASAINTTSTSKIPTAAFTWTPSTVSTFSPSATITTTTSLVGKPSTPVVQNKDNTKPSEVASTGPDFTKISGNFPGFNSVASSNTTNKLQFSGGFQIPTTIQPAFGAVSSPSTLRNKSASGVDFTDSHHEERVEDFVPTAEFEPVIPLPPLVEVLKGDENENVLFQHRAKLLRFVTETKEWKERGLGEIKILQAKDNPKKIRVVMWREKVHKIACNHWIARDMEITNYQGSLKNLMWTAVDFAEGEEDPKTEIFVCRFGQEEKAQEFKKEMEKSITLVKNAPSDTPEKSTATTISVKKEQAQTPKELPKLADVYKRPEGEWNCSACYSPNKKDSVACASCTTPKPGHTPIASSQPSKEAVTNPPKFTFGFSTPTFSNSTTPTTTSTTTTTPLTTSTATSTPTSKPVFGFTGFGSPAITSTITSTTTATTTTPKTEGGSIFTLSSNAKSVTPSSSFSWTPTTTTTTTTSQQKEKEESKAEDEKKEPDFAKLSENFQGFNSFAPATVAKPFSGHGFQTPATIKPVFGAVSSPVVSSSNGVDSSRHGEERVEDFVPTAEFEPVIPLPPLVEVVKGDENENVLFQHRAKLLRFVTETKEWKERGLGEIKILQAKDNPKKIRVVMWREKVHKIACNHWIARDMEITNYQGSLKNLMWTAVDFAEGEEDPKTEIFVCRFGQEEKAQEFKREMENAVAIVKNSPDTPEHPKEASSSDTSLQSKSVKPLSELFKKPEGEWNCEACYCSNNKDSLNCVSCCTPKAGSSALPNAGGDASNEGKNMSDLKEKAESLQLPSHLLTQESDKPNHDHCRGCDVETFDFSILDGREVPNFEDIPKPQRPAETQNETLKDLLTKNTSPPKGIIPQTTTPVTGSGDVKTTTASSLANFNFALPSSTISSTPSSTVPNTTTNAASFNLPTFSFTPNFSFQNTENTTTVGNNKSIFSGGISGIPSTVENLNPKINGGGGGNGEEEQVGEGEQEDNEDEEEEEEEDQMFENENVHAYVRETSAGEFVDYGEGSLRVVYDGDQYCARLVFQSHTTDDYLEHYIATETTVLDAGENTFEWDFISLTNGNGEKNRIRVILPDPQVYASFSKIMAESVDMAMKIGVTEQDLRDDAQQNDVRGEN